MYFPGEGFTNHPLAVAICPASVLLDKDSSNVPPLSLPSPGPLGSLTGGSNYIEVRNAGQGSNPNLPRYLTA